VVVLLAKVLGPGKVPGTRKDVVTVGAKDLPTGLDLRLVMKPLQHDPGIHYPLPINRGAKDSAPGESVKKLPEEPPTLKKHGRPRKGSSLDEASKAKKENHLLWKRKYPWPKI